MSAKHGTAAVQTPLNPLIHEAARLQIVAVLNECSVADFNFLLGTTGLTRGNLSTHLSRLTAAGYVTENKTFVGRMPHTDYSLTETGREAYRNYLQAWQKVTNRRSSAEIAHAEVSPSARAQVTGKKIALRVYSSRCLSGRRRPHPIVDTSESKPMKKTATVKTVKKGKGAAKDGPAGADWRGETLARIRTLIQQADPAVVEEVKWRKPSNGMQGVPVWSHDGIICTGETYKSVVKMPFAQGASLEDPSRLFNSSLEGNTRRAIDIHEGEKIDEKALKALIRAAVELNAATAAERRGKKR